MCATRTFIHLSIRSRAGTLDCRRMSIQIQNYVRTLRRRHGLTQLQLAWLMGKSDRSVVSRIERGMRVPNLEMALAIEVILGAPVRKVFRGLANTVEGQVVRRRGITDDEDGANASRA